MYVLNDSLLHFWKNFDWLEGVQLHVALSVILNVSGKHIRMIRVGN